MRAGGGGGGGGGPAARSGGVDLPSVLFRRKDSFSREAPSLARLVLEHGALTLSLSLPIFSRFLSLSLSLCVGATCSVTDFDGKRRSPDRLQLTASRACVIPPILLLYLDPYVMCVCTLLGTWVHRSDHCF